MLKISFKKSCFSLALLVFCQIILASEARVEKKSLCSYLVSSCERVLSCFKKNKKSLVNEKKNLLRKKSFDSLTKTITFEDYKKTLEPWILIEGVIYDVGNFVEQHPGGAEMISDLYGSDASTDFLASHNLALIKEYPEVRAVARVVL